MIKTRRREGEVAPGSWFMALAPARPLRAAAVTCHGGLWTRLRWTALSLPGKGERDPIGSSCRVGFGSSASCIHPEALVELLFRAKHPSLQGAGLDYRADEARPSSDPHRVWSLEIANRCGRDTCPVQSIVNPRKAVKGSEGRVSTTETRLA